MNKAFKSKPPAFDCRPRVRMLGMDGVSSPSVGTRVIFTDKGHTGTTAGPVELFNLGA